MKLFSIVLSLALMAFFQKTMAQSEKKQQTAVLNHIAVYVADLKKATDFYQVVFNLEQIPEPFKDGKHTWLSLGAAGQLHLIQGVKSNVEHEKNDHLCFSVASVDTFAAQLSTKNIAFENWAGKAKTITERVDGVKQIYFKDPDGHWLEVNDAK